MTKKEYPITKCGFCGKKLTDGSAATIEEMFSHNCRKKGIAL